MTSFEEAKAKGIEVYRIVPTVVRKHAREHPGTFFDSVLCPFQDYFTHRDEPIDRWGETGVPRENHLTHP